MTKKKEAAERVRKEYAPAGTKTQTRFGFLLDNELLEWLHQQPNKGRYINRLIKADMEQAQSAAHADDA